MKLNKHESILGFLARLSGELDPSSWEVVDHWDSDLHAIGIARRGEPGVLVFVSTRRQLPGRFFCSLELPPPPGDDAPYRPAGDRDGVEFPDVLRLVREHLSNVARG
jgi:hypothetical protein